MTKLIKTIKMTMFAIITLIIGWFIGRYYYPYTYNITPDADAAIVFKFGYYAGGIRSLSALGDLDGFCQWGDKAIDLLQRGNRADFNAMMHAQIEEQKRETTKSVIENL